MSMVEKLAYVKRRKGMTSNEISQRSGVPRGTVNKIFAGQTQNPSPQALEHICQVLRVPLHYLLDDDIPTEACIGAYAEKDGLQLISDRECQMLHSYCLLTEHGRKAVDSVIGLLLDQAPRPFPRGSYRTMVCYQTVAQGRHGAFGDSFQFRSIEALVDPIVEQADFAIMLTDHAMYPVYHSGTILAVRNEPVEHNQLGIFLVNRELYIRKLQRKRGGKRLVSINLEYKDVTVSERDEFRCLGGVVGAVRNYHWL